MKVDMIVDLKDNYISPLDKFLDEFNGSAKDFRGLFLVPKKNVANKNLHQTICSTAKDNFESTGGELTLFRLEFTKDKQITNWMNKTEET